MSLDVLDFRSAYYICQRSTAFAAPIIGRRIFCTALIAYFNQIININQSCKLFMLTAEVIIFCVFDAAGRTNFNQIFRIFKFNQFLMFTAVIMGFIINLSADRTFLLIWRNLNHLLRITYTTRYFTVFYSIFT